MNLLEITIQHRRQEEGWPVAVECSRHGELPRLSEGLLVLNKEFRSDLLKLRLDLSGYGTYLGKALFQGAVLVEFARTLYEAGASGEPLRILLAVESEELRSLRWERLCAPTSSGSWDFLALSQQTLYSLRLLSLTARRFPTMGRRDLNALVLLASPPEGNARFAVFDAQATADSVGRALGDIPCKFLGPVKDAVGPASIDALCAQMTEQNFSLLHVVAHGFYDDAGKDTVVCLLDDRHQLAPTTATAFVRRLDRCARLPLLAFLCTCESAMPEAEEALGGLAQRLVRELGMPAVVAMTDRVAIATAEKLSADFWRRLLVSGLPDQALAEAGAGLQDRRDILVPALFSRLGSRPLFSDDLGDRDLTDKEIAWGMERIAQLLPERAPVLQQEFAGYSDVVRRYFGTDPNALGREAQKERRDALDNVRDLGERVLEVSFSHVALGGAIPSYNAAVCPFPGLKAFQVGEEKFFFGRGRQVELFAARLLEERFLAVLGASGSGKSSLVLAGLAPFLGRLAEKQGRPFDVVCLTPGPDPAEILSARLGRPMPSGRTTLLVVDQLEELFTLCNDAASRGTFLRSLLKAREEQPDLLLVLVLQADFWGDCALHPELGELMEGHQKLLAPMTSAELRNAMEQQASAVGLRFEAGLSHAVLSEVEGEPGAMPLLQHLLLELWKRRHGRWLTASEYARTGGVKHAVAQAADAVCNEMRDDREGLEFLRHAFIRLTRLDERREPDGQFQYRDVRRRARLDDLMPANADADARNRMRMLAERLVEAHLFVSSIDETTGEVEVEVAHEALIRFWPRLRTWLDEDRESLMVLAAVRQQAKDWEDNGRPTDELPRWGERLERVEALFERDQFALNKLEQEFLRAARKLHERMLGEREEADRSIRHNLGLALNERAAMAAKEGRPLRARLYSLHALSQPLREGSAAFEEAVLCALANPVALPAFRSPDASLHDGPVTSVAFSPDGRILATGSDDATAALWDLDTGRRLFLLAGHKKAVRGVAFSPDGRILATGSDDATAVLWDVDTGKLLQVFRRHANHVLDVTFSPDGHVLATGSRDKTAWLWDVATGMPVQTMKGHKGPVRSVAFSPDGRTLATGSVDNTAQLWDVAAGSRLQNLTGHSEAVLSVAFSPNGAILATGSKDKTAALWDVATGSRLQNLTGHLEEVSSVAFSPNGAILATGSKDKTVMLWDPMADKPLHVLKGHADRVNDVAFSPDGRILATVAHDKGVVFWNAAAGRRLKPLEGHGGMVSSAAISPDGRILATGSTDSTAALWDMATGSRLRDLAGHSGAVFSVAFSPDGRMLATGSADKTAALWDMATGSRLRDLAGHSGAVSSVAFSLDGRTLATGSDDATAALWDVATGSRLRDLAGHSGAVFSVAFSPDGRMLATGSRDGRAWLWDVASVRQLVVLEGHGGMVTSVAFSPDGRTLATGSDDATAALWDVATGSRLRDLAGHSGAVFSVAFSPDGRMLATGSRDGRAWLWDVASVRQLVVLEGHGGMVTSVAFSPDGRTLATGSDDATAALWDVASVRQLVVLEGHGDMVTSVAFSPDGRMLATGSRDGRAWLWDVAAVRRLMVLERHGGMVTSVAFSPDGRTLATGSDDATVAIWDAITGRRMNMLKKHEQRVASVTFSPDGLRLATGSSDGRAVLWDAVAGEPLEIFQHDRPVTSVTLSQDGTILATGSGNGKGDAATLWDVATGRRLQEFQWNYGQINSVAFSPDGRTLATGSTDDAAVLWDVAKGEPLRILEGGNGTVTSVAFSPDGRMLATGVHDNAAVLWDVASGRRVQMLAGHRKRVRSVAFSPDGRTVATSADDGLVLLWEIGDDPGGWFGLAVGPDSKYVLELDRLPWKLKGLDFVPSTDGRSLQGVPAESARWGRRHPLHWLARAEAGNPDAMLELGQIHDRNDDLVQALRWYGKAMQAGSVRAKEQRDRLLRWLEDEENRKRMPKHLLLALCAAKEELGLSGFLPEACGS